VSLNHYVTPQQNSVYIITSLASLALSVVIISYETYLKWNVGFDFMYICLFGTFVALRRIQQDTNLCRSSCKMMAIFAQFQQSVISGRF
jgi:hypothetical protein